MTPTRETLAWNEDLLPLPRHPCLESLQLVATLGISIVRWSDRRTRAAIRLVSKMISARRRRAQHRHPDRKSKECFAHGLVDLTREQNIQPEGVR